LEEKDIIRNRRASFDYELEDRYEAGIVLTGSEVKSLRAGLAELGDAYASVDHGEAWLKQMRIAPFKMASAFPHEPKRARKLLLHAHEIEALLKATQRGGYTIIPLRLYFDTHGRVKVELAIGKGKTKGDKRQAIKKKDAEREAREAIARRGRN
jgi:SsrA-binding protein